MTTRYEYLVIQLICRVVDGLPRPNADIEQLAAIEVCRTTKMTPAVWATLSAPEREPWLEETIRQLSPDEVQAAQPAVLGSENVEAVWLGDRKVQIGSEPPLALPQQYATVLERLVELKSADSSQLERYGGGPKKLRDMVKRFPKLDPFVILPGGKSKGGYRTTIRDGRGEVANRSLSAPKRA